MTKIHRKVRLPTDLISILRYIRDSIGNRSVPVLVNICLKQTRGVSCLDYAPTTRYSSEAIDLWLYEEYANLEAAELRARIAHALVGVDTTIDWNRTGVTVCPAMECLQQQPACR